MTDGALVIGADYRALGVVRSLGRRGVPVWVLRHGDDRLAGMSRFARRTLPLVDGTAFLLDLCRTHRLDGWTLFATGDETAAFVARHHDELAACFRLTTPPWAVTRYAYDKRLTYPLAESLGLDVPRTWYPRDGADVAAIDCAFPVAIKPAVKDGFNRLTAAKAWRVDSPDELRARYEEACTLVDPETLMVQDVIPGGGSEQLSYAAVCDAGRPLAALTARRTRQFPMDFGRASTHVETAHLPDVEEPARALLEHIGYTGLVEVEFKRDPRDGRCKLLDVNPRVWGWHTLGARAGVDFAYLAWRLARGETVPASTPRPGVRWTRLSTDLPTVLQEIRRGRLSVRDYLRSLSGPREHAIFARDDPLPGLLELPLLASLVARRLVRGSAV
ncbi:MAG TPA: ATP-grasp domain-containing protein [Gaiellaceae bacterium]|nr:ATP-grasp domain-containing protein [Gaiellaceae bacterium]